MMNSNSVKLLRVRDFTRAQLKHEAGGVSAAAETLSAAQRTHSYRSMQPASQKVTFRYQPFKIMQCFPVAT